MLLHFMQQHTDTRCTHIGLPVHSLGVSIPLALARVNRYYLPTMYRQCSTILWIRKTFPLRICFASSRLFLLISDSQIAYIITYLLIGSGNGIIGNEGAYAHP